MLDLLIDLKLSTAIFSDVPFSILITWCELYVCVYIYIYVHMYANIMYVYMYYVCMYEYMCMSTYVWMLCVHTAMTSQHVYKILTLICNSESEQSMDLRPKRATALTAWYHSFLFMLITSLTTEFWKSIISVLPLKCPVQNCRNMDIKVWGCARQGWV